MGAKREEEESVSTDTDTVTEDEDEEDIFDPTSIHPAGWLALALSASASSVRVQPGSAHGSIAEGGRRGAAPQGIMSWMKRNVASKMKMKTPTPKGGLDEQEPRVKSQEPRAHAAEPRTRSKINKSGEREMKNNERNERNETNER